MINVSNLSFRYDKYPTNIFGNVSFIIDTNWKLGFIGRNGKGKTTFLNLLLNKYEYSGSITSNVEFDYFPFNIENKNLSSYEIINIEYEQWKLEREISLMDMSVEALSRPFKTLSKGEQTKVMLAMLFLKENNFLLIDEPTNHLDSEARITIANYLNKKRGFILVSHDRNFIDKCTDHILSINKTTIEIKQGNFTSWYENKTRQDNFEKNENEKLKRNIKALEKSAKQTASWANKIEESKYNISKDQPKDKGYIGHKSAKMMKRSLNAQRRKEKAIKEKETLLKDIETTEALKLEKYKTRPGRLIEARNLTISYEKQLFKPLNFIIESGNRINLKGKNGSGKSSLIKLLLNENIKYNGEFNVLSNLKISYIQQDTSSLKGNLKEYTNQNNIDETLFKSILKKLDFERTQFEKNIENYSEGQKKKVLIAKSLCEEANIYIWDEPLNYIDIFSRIQIEELLLKYKPTIIFVEHDEIFAQKVANKVIHLEE